MNPPALYIHIPFCEAKCGYCDFYSVPRGWEEFGLQEQYVEALYKEIDERLNRSVVGGARHPFETVLLDAAQRDAETTGPATQRVQSIFFGGGTPSLLRVDLVEKILRHLQKYFSWDEACEITMEANPKTVSFDKLKDFRSLGINRISIGIQSFQDRFLQVLGRIHSGKEACATVADAFRAGFENISLDLIFSLPEQNLVDWQKDLEAALSYGTTHLSCYALTIETGTPFEKLSLQGKLNLPKEEEVLRQFQWTRHHLAEAGLPSYEISNFAQPGYESIHNQNYWRYGEYLGFGVAASSFARTGRVLPPMDAPGGAIFAIRRNNVRNLNAYLKDNGQCEEDLISREMARGEFVMLALRTREGLSLKDFSECFEISFEEAFPELPRKFESLGLLESDGHNWRLTEKGVEIADSVIAEFIAGSGGEHIGESRHAGSTPPRRVYRSAPGL